MKLVDQLMMFLRANPDKKIYDIADEIGIPRSMLYNFLRNKQDIRHSNAEKIREYIEK